MLCSERNKIETVFSSIVSRMPRYIHARTESGFCLKVTFFILAYLIHWDNHPPSVILAIQMSI